MDRFDRSLLSAAHSSGRTAVLWRARAVSRLWEALNSMVVDLKGWRLLQCAALLTSVVEMSSAEAPVKLELVQPLWHLYRRVYVEDSSARTASGSLFIRTFVRLFFAVS